MKNDSFYMQKAINLARKGIGYTSPNPLVGAVVVKNNVIIGSGYHQYYGGPHAEVNALEEAGFEAKDSVLYVNLEPCSHYGKTPPCTKKIIEAGVTRVVVAMTDPNPRVSGNGIKQLREAGVEVDVGVLEVKARKLNEVFVKYMTANVPFVYLKTAQTLDGYLATKTGNSKWVTNEKARNYGHRLRHRVDAILVGINTVLSDNPRLTTRLQDEEGLDSIRVVLDPSLKISAEARVINNSSPKKTIIVTGKKVDSKKLDKFKNNDVVEIWSFQLNDKGYIPLDKLMSSFYKADISSLLVEGGGRISHSFLHGGFVDKYYCFIAPRLLGGNDGISSFQGPGPELMENALSLKETEIQTLDDNLLLIGRL